MESREHKPASVCSPRWMNLGLCVAVLICGYVTSADSNEILSIATFRDIAEAEIPSPRGWAASKTPLISIDVLGRQEIPLDTFMCEKLIWCKGKFSWRFRESSVSIIVNVTALGGPLPFRLNLFFIDGQEETTCVPDCENDKVFLESNTDGSGSIELDREDYLCLGNQSVEVYSFNVDENKLTSIEIQTAFDNRLLFPINFDPIVSFPTRMFIFPTEDTAGLECPVGKWCLNHTCWQWSEQNSTLLYVVEINLITFKDFTNCTVVFLNEINQFYDIFLLASGNPKYNFITKGRIDIATFDDEVRIQIPLDTIYDLQAAKQIKILPVFLPFIQKPKIEPLYWTQEDLEQKPTYLFRGSFGAQDSKSVYAMSAVERNAHYDGGLYYVTLKKLGVHPADDEELLLCVDPVNGVGTCNIGLSRSVLKIPPVPDVYIFKDGETIGFKCEMNRKCMYEGSWDFVNLYNERTTALEFKFPTGGRVLNYNVYLLDPKDPSKKWIYKLIILNNALRAQDLVISEAVSEEEDMATFSFNISWTTDLYNYAYFVRANDSTGSGCHIGRWCRNLTFWEAKKAHDRLSIVIKLKNPRNELLSNLSIFLLDHNRLQFRIYSLSTMNDKGSYKDQETSQSESTKNVIIAVLSVFAGACAILILVMFSIYVLKLRGASSGREAAPAAPPEFQRPLSDSYEELPEIVTHEGYEQLGERSSPNEYTAATNLDVLHISKGGASERKASSTNSYQSIGSGKFEPRPQVSEKNHSETNLKAAKSFILNDREKHGACASKVLKVRTKSEPCWGRESREREGTTCKVDESDELSPSACFMLGASTESRRHAKASYSAEASGASDNIELKDLTSPICFMLGASTEDKRQTNSFCPAGSNTENGDINMKDLPTPVYFKLVTSKGDQSHEAVFSCFEAKRVENKFAKQNLDTGSCEPDGDGEYLTTLDASREHEDYLELLED